MAPHPPEVRRYLREFLGDPRVLDMNPLGRRLLLDLVILPFKPRRSAEAYEKVWLPEGSPLLVHSRPHAEGLRRALGPDYDVALGMRYGSPSIASALDRFRAGGIDPIVLFPLFPQYAPATSGTSLEAAFRLAGERWNVPSLAVVPAFYDDPAFIAAFAETGRPVLESLRPDHVMFSFHGLPERQVRKSDETGSHCLASEGCCDRIGEANRNCYRAQCFSTARELGRRFIARETIIRATESYEIVEAYPEDKYFPSYLLLGKHGADEAFHVLFGADVEGRNVRIVTTYYPSPEEWEADLKTRRRPS